MKLDSFELFKKINNLIKQPDLLCRKDMKKTGKSRFIEIYFQFQWDRFFVKMNTFLR